MSYLGWQRLPDRIRWNLWHKKENTSNTVSDDSFTFKYTHTQNKHVKSILASVSLHHRMYEGSTQTYQSLQDLVSWVFPAVNRLCKKDLFKQKHLVDSPSMANDELFYDS